MTNAVYTIQCIHKTESIIGHKRCILSAHDIILHIWSVHTIYKKRMHLFSSLHKKKKKKSSLLSILFDTISSAGEAGPQFAPDISSSWSRRNLCGET